MPSYRDATQNPLIVKDLVALIDKLGPCILVGHSTGGSNVLSAATERPDLVKGLIALEPGAFPPASTNGQFAKVPLTIPLGDHQSQTTISNVRSFTDTVKVWAATLQR